MPTNTTATPPTLDDGATRSVKTLTFRQWREAHNLPAGARLVATPDGSSVFVAGANGEALTGALSTGMVHALGLALSEAKPIRITL